jgi:tetratricopeptide (TPR) repeat protein
VKQLAVISRTSAIQYDRRGRTLPQIGRDLGVDFVVEGTVRWASGSDGSRVRITPQLIRVADDTHVWTQRYDATVNDVFKVQSDIAYQVIGALQVALDVRERQTVDARHTENFEAYQAFLKGVYYAQRGSSDTSNQEKALGNFERAVAQDPAFALAWSWLSRICSTRYNTGADRRTETADRAREAARRALEIDPHLADAHVAQAAYLLGVHRDYDGALSEIEIARAGLPNSSELQGMEGVIERRRGRWSVSLAGLKRAFELDPRSAGRSEALAVHHLLTRDYDEALRFIGIARALDPSPTAGVAVPHAWALFSGKQNPSGARAVLESAALDDARVRSLLARFEFFDGRHERALDLLSGLPAGGAWLAPNFRFPRAIAEAQVYEAMKRHDEAVSRYRAAIAELQGRRATTEDYQVEAALGLAYAGIGNARDAVTHARRAVALQPVTRDAAEGPLYLYLLAQVYAQVGQAAVAFEQLETMLDLPGFYNAAWIERDPAFAPLRADPGYGAFLQRMSAIRPAGA